MSKSQGCLLCQSKCWILGWFTRQTNKADLIRGDSKAISFQWRRRRMPLLIPQWWKLHSYSSKKRRKLQCSKIRNYVKLNRWIWFTPNNWQEKSQFELEKCYSGIRVLTKTVELNQNGCFTFSNIAKTKWCWKSQIGRNAQTVQLYPSHFEISDNRRLSEKQSSLQLCRQEPVVTISCSQKQRFRCAWLPYSSLTATLSNPVQAVLLAVLKFHTTKDL